MRLKSVRVRIWQETILASLKKYSLTVNSFFYPHKHGMSGKK